MYPPHRTTAVLSVDVFADEVRRLRRDLLLKGPDVILELDLVVGNSVEIDAVFRVWEQRLQEEVTVAE